MQKLPQKKNCCQIGSSDSSICFNSSRDRVIIFVSYFTPQFILAGVSSRMEPALAEPCENTEIQCALQEGDKPCFFSSQEI